MNILNLGKFKIEGLKNAQPKIASGNTTFDEMINSENEDYFAYSVSLNPSDNDYILNSLLSLLPKRIILHSYDNSNDEFMDTLKMIFEKRLEFCSDCNICNLFSATKNAIHQV